MKKIFLLAQVFLLSLVVNAQVVTDNSNTVQYYVQNVLLGTGVSVSNITFNGGNANVVNPSVGEFTDANSMIGLPAGFAMGTGDIDLASQPNNSGNASLGGGGAAGQDPDLAIIATNTLVDQCIVEFDFIPTGDTISFNFVFASEEYPEYVCSGFNDVFGFFLTGTNPYGPNYVAENIALVPDPNNPGSFTSTEVAINTINPGVAGANGSSINCSNIDANWQSYSAYYVSNDANSGNSPSFVYDGRTVSIPVVAPVVCGETYHIKLAIADAGDEFYDSGVFLEAGSFSANGTLDATTADVPTNVQLCGSPFNVTFNTGPNPPPASYWDLGDGTTYANLDTVNHTYADSGTYVVMYVADDPSPCVQADTAYFTVDVIQTGTLDAQIDIPPYNPCQDSLTIQLAFTGTGADSLYWDMGDGTTFINDTLISYTYYTNDDYVVTFQAYDFACGGFNTITDTIHFNPVFTSVTATTPGDQEYCGAPFSVDFTSGGTPPPNSYWDFGDIVPNDTSTLDNVTYTYGDTGSYTVMYVAIDSNTCNIADTAYFDITLAPAEVLDAQFTIPPYNDCQDSLTIQLAFTGTGADSLYWDMGEGTIYTNDTLINHTYTSNGDFVITFEAYDLQCNTSAVLTDTVHFNPNYTSVQATSPGDQEICGAPFNVDFTSGITPPPNNFWDFGDGSGTSTLADLTYTYADTGSYTVMYVAIDSTTCNIADTAYFDITIIQPEQLSASINIPPYDPCTTGGLTVDYAFTGTGADSLYWVMGDGTTYMDSLSFSYTYNTPGTYYVEFQAYEFTCGTSSVILDTIDFNPTYTAVQTINMPDQTICNAPYSVVFDAGVTPPNSYWDFGDGNNSGIGTDNNLSHTYSGVGTYTVTYVAIDSSTCNISDTTSFTVNIIQPAPLSASIDIPTYDPCTVGGLTVDYAFTGSGADSLYWDMGTGDIFIDDVSFSYTYDTPGTYYVEMQAYNFACGTSSTIRDTIDFNPNPIFVNTNIDPDVDVCGTALAVDFSSGNPAPPQNYWDFGDGNTSTAINPTHTYAVSGTYNGFFVAIDSSTCNIADTMYFPITVNLIPELNVNIDYTPPVPCEAVTYEVNLEANVEGADSIYWNMGDGMEFYNDTLIAYEYGAPGTYPITIVLFKEGCAPKVISNEATFIELGESSGIIPNVFTPNGDGMNDELVFLGVDQTQDYSIRIFNRWGKTVFESTDAKNNWDGKDSRDGTYFYELRYTDVCSEEEKLVTGTVTLIGKD
jgi:gliding motility-associated-like protein